MSVARRVNFPAWASGIPAGTEPKTVGEHLRKRRFDLRINQAQAAKRLSVSRWTLSLWERDRIYPPWGHQPRVAEYLGSDPFTDPALGSPQGNEPSFVASLALTGPLTFGQRIRKRRVELKKNRKECAKELGVSERTLWSWETGTYQPSSSHVERIAAVLGFDPAEKRVTVSPVSPAVSGIDSTATLALPLSDDESP